MVFKSIKHVFKEFSTIWNNTLHGINDKLNNSDYGPIDKTTLTSINRADGNNTNIYKTQTLSDLHPSISTTLITATADNTTQSTMTWNIVSTFPILSSDLLDTSHHNVMVAILFAIFMCITLTITVSIFVFCRKKNTVFMLQKCEQDSDLEMNDIITEADTSDSEYEYIKSTSPLNSSKRSQTYPNLHKYANGERTTEENQHLNLEKPTKHSKNRSSITRNKHKESGSPTSKPLLYSNSQTGLRVSKESLYANRKIPKHSLSISDYNQAGASATEEMLTSNAVHKQTRKLNKSKETVSKQDEPPSQSVVFNPEHAFLSVKVTNTNEKVKEKTSVWS